MAKQLRVPLKIGMKGKKVVAMAPDWPAPGRCNTCFGIPRITRWITPGKWKTKT